MITVLKKLLTKNYKDFKETYYVLGAVLNPSEVQNDFYELDN